MSNRLIEIDWHPSHRKLRQFAFFLAILLIVMAWFRGYVWQAGLAGGLVMAVSWLWPAALWPVYGVVTLVTVPFGMVIGELALLFIYCGVFLPIGLLFRAMNRDALQRKLDRDAVSYWVECRPEPEKKSYLRRY